MVSKKCAELHPALESNLVLLGLETAFRLLLLPVSSITAWNGRLFLFGTISELVEMPTVATAPFLWG